MHVCWQVLAAFTAVIGVVTSFISHTVGAMVMLPIVQSVGQEIAKASGEDHANLLVMGCATSHPRFRHQVVQLDNVK